MTKEKLTERHTSLLYGAPSPAHLELYGASPRKRGFGSTHMLSREQESVLLDAVVVLAVEQAAKAMELGGSGDPPKVFLFVPANLEGWAAQEIKRVAARMFEVCKGIVRVNSAVGIGRAKFLGTFFRNLMIGSRLDVQAVPPAHWVAFGFEDSDDLPRWLRNALVSLSPFERDD